MVERFRGSGNRRGDLNPRKTNSFPAHRPIEDSLIETSTIANLRRFVPLGLPIVENGLQEVKSHINNVGCPPTPGFLVTPVVREPVRKARRVRNDGEIGGGTSKKSLQNAKKQNRKK